MLLGLDRAPEVKTVRRKLHEIGARKLSRTLADAFARRWVQAEPEALGYLYIDGHVRPYHGRRHRIPKTFVQRRRLCMPATTEVWVNDARAQPWFFVTTEANDHLLAAIERDILAPLRKEVGAQRRVTLVFDREGWSPKAFARWAAGGFDVMTYRKGRYDPWPQDAFVAVVDPTPSRDGKPVTWRLAECETDLGTGRGRPVFRMREVRRLCDNGHQTSIMTTRRDLATPQVPEPGENLALGKVTVANHPLAPIGQLLLDERRQVLLQLRRDRGLDQPPRAGPQKLRQGVRNPCWRPQRNHSIVAHVCGVLLLPKPSFPTRFQQRHTAQLNSSVHHFRP